MLREHHEMLWLCLNLVQNITILWTFEILVVKFFTPVVFSQLRLFFSVSVLVTAILSYTLFSFYNCWGGEKIKKLFLTILRNYYFITLNFFCRIPVSQIVLCGPLGFPIDLTGEKNRINEHSFPHFINQYVRIIW